MILKRRPKKITICYLCGQALSKPIDKDHVPPDRWLAKQFRVGTPSPQLLTLPVHPQCQDQFEDDEVYFFNTLVPLASQSVAGSAALKDLAESFKHPQQLALGWKVRDEFGKVTLPDGTVLKSIVPSRVNRVIWKVVRGLFFVEYDGRVLPEPTPNLINLYAGEGPSAKLPEEFAYVRDTESRGRYPAAFDYKVQFYKDPDDPSIMVHYWALLLWDRMVAIVAFHDPDCDCETCVGLVPEES